MKRMRLSQTCRFEAAHFLPKLAEGHKCRAMHGHNYKVVATVAGLVDDTGILVDFHDIEDALQAACDQLDHRLLNDVNGLDNPTAENLCAWFWDQLREHLPLVEIVVYENEASACYYTGE